ncbi:hypothetical protein V1264_000777 [Littorina saxatilis]|uniref:MAM domain-containing protein n=1 Tax=Littorina saxatilis TaxID=31220 RepID=A0AAN9BZR8_9CAEN
MEQTFALVSLLLLCMSLPTCAGGCHPHGPENCTFSRREFFSSNRAFCSWSLGNFTYVFGSVSENRTCAGLMFGKEKGNITSRTACSTEGKEHCLRLEYKFQRNDSIDLSVSIKDDGPDDVGSPMWTVSSGHGWNKATIPFNTTRNFNVVIIAAKRRPGHMAGILMSTVNVGDISYTKAPCLPPSFPAVSTNPTTQTSTPPTTKTMTTAGAKTNDSKSSPSDTPSKPAGNTVSVATPANDQDTRVGVQAVSVPPSNKTGLITACVIIVILVVVIIVLAVLVVVFRRKYLHLLEEERLQMYVQP